jgi:hypothetical protein
MQFNTFSRMKWNRTSSFIGPLWYHLSLDHAIIHVFVPWSYNNINNGYMKNKTNINNGMVLILAVTVESNYVSRDIPFRFPNLEIPST